MLNRWRLPPDDFPDETETAAFQNYREGRGRVGEILSVLLGRRRVVLMAAGFVVSVGIVWLALYTWSEPKEIRVIVPPDDATEVVEDVEPSPELAVPIGGDFPADVAQELIQIPAQIDDSLAFGTRQGYTFRAEAGVTWEITVFGATGFDPAISLYGPPNGQLLASNDDRSLGDLTSELTLTVQQGGIYSVLLEGSGGASGGGYTLRIVPVE